MHQFTKVHNFYIIEILVKAVYMIIYSKSMKTEHLYIRYFPNIDLSIKIVFSPDNCTLHILPKTILCIDWFPICMVLKYFLENMLFSSLLCSAWAIFISCSPNWPS